MAGVVYKCLLVFCTFLVFNVHYGVRGKIAKLPFLKSLNDSKPDQGKDSNATIPFPLKDGEDKQFIKKIRLEMIKQDILNKLQMKCRPPPMYSKRRLIPKPVFEGNIDKSGKLEELADGSKSVTTQIVVPAQRALGTRFNSRCASSLCFGIRFSHRLCENKVVNSARLRLFKTIPSGSMPLQRISVYELGSTENEVRLITREEAFVPTSGWVSLDITKLIKDWVRLGTNESSENHYLQIVCERCFSRLQFETDEDSRERPYLVINVEDDQSRKRNKRSLDCPMKTKDCCRKLFYVSFAEIGWDDWIIQPLGFDANYCEGLCEGYFSPPNPHRSIMQRISSDKNIKAEFSPCCVATNMRALPLLYFDEEGFIFKRDIPNMTVDSCACS